MHNVELSSRASLARLYLRDIRWLRCFRPGSRRLADTICRLLILRYVVLSEIPVPTFHTPSLICLRSPSHIERRRLFRWSRIKFTQLLCLLIFIIRIHARLGIELAIGSFTVVYTLNLLRIASHDMSLAQILDLFWFITNTLWSIHF